MWHFATESGKSKRQFYTPAEVSRIMAQILGIRVSNNAVGCEPKNDLGEIYVGAVNAGQ
jgi:type I restriction-modification system DNA methylase subunit